MNRCVITGRLVRDPELKQTKKNTPICKFTIATNEKETSFIDCVVWDKQAENLCKYQKKGNLIAVLGKIRTDSYEISGVKRKETYITVGEIEYLEKVEKNEFENASIKSDFQIGEQLEITDDDYPF